MHGLKTPGSAGEAREIQESMRGQVRLEDDFGDVGIIAGIDVGYDPKRNLARAALVTMSPERLKPIEEIVEFAPVSFPYIPGLLSFREAPVIMQALARLKNLPDLLFIDGQGVAHPRRMGIACHIGLLSGLPAIGVAKSRLCGLYKEPAMLKGAAKPLMDGRERIGTILRSREGIKPIFISPGHRISHQSAVEYTLRGLTRYRLPEPTRLADKLSKFSKDL